MQYLTNHYRCPQDMFKDVKYPPLDDYLSIFEVEEKEKNPEDITPCQLRSWSVRTDDGRRETFSVNFYSGVALNWFV